MSVSITVFTANGDILRESPAAAVTSSGTDAGDISLYLAAIPLFGSLALFLFFPAIAPMLAGSDLPPPSA